MKHERILQRIAHVLRTAEGEENALTSTAIAKRIGIRKTSREIRRIISGNIDWFWDQDICLLATAGVGYYLGNDVEQFRIYRDYLTALGLTISTKSKSLSQLCARKGIHL
jgi:hypothetical protein